MYKRLYNFLEKKEIIFSLQFGFWEKYSTTHTLIYLRDKINHEIDKGNCSCWIILDFQKAFDKVDHHVLLKKLEYHFVRGISNKWFALCLSTRRQFVSITDYNSNLAGVKCGVSQGLIVRPLKYSEVQNVADDTNLLTFNSWVKSINKQVNYDLKNVTNWLKANTFFLNVRKTELVLFTSAKKQLDCNLKIKLNEKRLYELGSAKYLEIQIGKSLTWEQKIDFVVVELNRAISLSS